MDQQILKRVSEIAGDILGVDVTAPSSPDSVENWDSVHHLDIQLALEQEYGITFLPEEWDEAKSIGDIAALVARKRG